MIATTDPAEPAAVLIPSAEHGCWLIYHRTGPLRGWLSSCVRCAGAMLSRPWRLATAKEARKIERQMRMGMKAGEN